MQDNYSETLRKKFHNVLSLQENETERKAAFMALLGQELVMRGVSLPVIVGGMATEIFSFGKYTSDDIDIKSDQGKTFYLLTQLEFERHGEHVWFSKEFKIIIDWLGADFEQGPEVNKRILNVQTEYGPIALVPLEELIVDRLCAAKFWKHGASLMWAKYLYESADAFDIEIDDAYFHKCLVRENVVDIFEENITQIESETNGPRY